MISARTLLLLFGFVLFFLIGVIGYISDSLSFDVLFGSPVRKPAIVAYALWFGFGFIYFFVTLASLRHDLSNRKRKP